MTAMGSFVHEEVASRVLFGAGARVRIPEEVDRLGVRRLALISGRRSQDVARELADACGERVVALLPHAEMHVPAEVADRCSEEVGRVSADGLIAVGGGSAIGLAKAVARRREVAILAVPTTYSGSEMTPIWGETVNGRKTTGRSWEVKPRTVIYDVDLTMSLPRELTVSSGVNAVAHAVEGLYAPDASPLRKLVAEEGIRKSVAALPDLVDEPHDRTARSEMLQAAWMCATVLGATTMGLHHKLCHALGGILNLPHAETHTVLLPHVMAFNLVPGGEARMLAVRAFGEAQPAQALWRRIALLGGPTSLRQFGMAPSQIPPIVEEVMSSAVTNPRSLDAQALTGLLSRALEGAEPVEASA